MKRITKQNFNADEKVADEREEEEEDDDDG